MIAALVLVFSFAQALEPTQMKIIDDQLTNRKNQLKAQQADYVKMEEKLTEILGKMDGVESDASAVNDLYKRRVAGAQAIAEWINHVKEKQLTPYKVPEWRTQFIKNLNEDCCRIKKDRRYREGLIKKIVRVNKNKARKAEEEDDD